MAYTKQHLCEQVLRKTLSKARPSGAECSHNRNQVVHAKPAKHIKKQRALCSQTLPQPTTNQVHISKSNIKVPYIRKTTMEHRKNQVHSPYVSFASDH